MPFFVTTFDPNFLDRELIVINSNYIKNYYKENANYKDSLY